MPVEIAGIQAGNVSRGHRILHGAAPVTIDRPTHYAEALRKAFVVVDVAARRHLIRKALDAATRTVAGARWREDEPLVETVVHLTEWPSVVLGDFEAEYLALPEEVLDEEKFWSVGRRPRIASRSSTSSSPPIRACACSGWRPIRSSRSRSPWTISIGPT